MNIWIKFEDNQEFKITYALNDDIFNLKDYIINEFPIRFAYTNFHHIIIKNKDSKVLNGSDIIKNLNLGDTKENCFIVEITNAPVTQEITRSKTIVTNSLNISSIIPPFIPWSKEGLFKFDLIDQDHLKVLTYPDLFTERYGRIPDSLIIRKSYKSLYDIICTNINNRDVIPFVALVTGVPGIGISMFILYFIYRYSKDVNVHDKSFVIQYDNDSYYYFHSFIAENNEFKFILSKLKRYLNFKIIDKILLVDFKDEQEPMRLAKATIIFSSPNEKRYHESMKSANSIMYYLPTWSYKELYLIDPRVNVWYDKFVIFGGVPRSVFGNNSVLIKLSETMQNKGSLIASHFSNSGRGNIDTESCYMLLHVNPLYIADDDDWIYDSVPVYSFASDYIFKEIYNRQKKQINTSALNVFNNWKGRHIDDLFSADNLFEKLVLWIYPLNNKKFNVARFDNNETFEINVPSDSQVLPLDWETKGLELNKLYIPRISNLESGNAFYASEFDNKIVLVVFQSTVWMENPILSNGLKDIFESFHCKITLNLLVFVTPTGDRLMTDQRIVTKNGYDIQMIPDCVKNFKQCYLRYSFASECRELLNSMSN